MNTLEVKNTNTAIARTFKPIMAATSTDIPTRIEVMRTGDWPDDSNKGHFTIAIEDLYQVKANFDTGIAMPGGAGFGLPIDFMHEEWNKAAGWMKSLEVEVLGTVGKLYANVEWTDAGKQALASGEFKCFSPAFYPGCLGSWHDPEDWSITAQNVLSGGGLTNIPFFKDLQPIMASASSGKPEDKNVIYINANAKENSGMTLEEVLAKDASTLEDDEKQLIIDNKDKLTDEQKTKFGLELENKDEKKEEPVEQTQEVKDAVALQASVKSGDKIIVEASKFSAMQTKITEMEKVTASYQQEKAESFVDEHMARGAIKADQRNTWVEKIMADESMKDMLTALPDNQVLADQQGTSTKDGDATRSAQDELHEKVTAAVTASEGKTSYGDAQKEILASNEDLNTRVNAERNS